ncbi:hypothetical protein PG997_002524 [Apiospora hydei]|uniref:Uncharacterized protein n=1 Tax=Apiospora hydei TaxID=1337664 RepID=A0ABR1WWM6_9PEZI
MASPVPSNNVSQTYIQTYIHGQISVQSPAFTAEKLFRDTLIVEDCLLLSSLCLDTDISDAPPRHKTFHSKLLTSVKKMRDARIDHWTTVSESLKSNSDNRSAQDDRVKAANKLVKTERDRLNSLVKKRVTEMMNKRMQPGLHLDYLESLLQRFPHVSDLRTSRPSTNGPQSHSSGILGLEVANTPLTANSTTSGVILPHALFPKDRRETIDKMMQSLNYSLDSIEPGRMRIVSTLKPLPVEPGTLVGLTQLRCSIQSVCLGVLFSQSDGGCTVLMVVVTRFSTHLAEWRKSSRRIR